MHKLCFSILIVCCGILKVIAGTCVVFEYEFKNNQWIGNLLMDSGTEFWTEWFLIEKDDTVTCSFPGGPTSNLVAFTLSYRKFAPVLTKVLANNKTVCSAKDPDSYSSKKYWFGTVPGSTYGTASSAYTSQKTVVGTVSSSYNSQQTVVSQSQISKTYSGNPFLGRLQPPTTTTTTRRTTTTPRPTQIALRTTAAPAVERRIVNATPQQTVNELCGRRTSTFTPFIVGGHQVTLGQIPWLVAIMAKVRGGVFFICGGSLISARTVISAAHCFQSRLTKDDVVLYLGKHQLDNYNERFETREPSNIIINTDYSMTIPPDADLAIIQFELPVGFTDKISPICLWTGPENVHEIAGQRGFVGGWGSDGQRNNVTNIPKMVDTSIVSDNVCRTDTHIPPQFVTSRVLCAGNLDDTGPCSGDSGSGLMININGRWQLRAIVSGGPKIDGECNLRSYVLYCDLAKHRTWLNRNILY